ncbi:cytochrome c oxidase accessory protein CcoG [Pseudoalteromonas sp. CO325X]|uniref:cytochrome c oxidase accessory protein CcoG n=1 Tax=Pseudoalteromonas sp. CO325X TaxID=1777262 RepID=UPI0010235365|nr:cytochrome c oxidase accessory protein CcoG [Pseudoalteromonas sp. CO325X]RZF86461.1 cytochrome c oxidase accessory protein CcoG [Pseudoalteromonas sp. CO325X]
MKFDIKEEDLIIKPYKQSGPIYVREQKGRYQRIRRVMSWALMIAFIALPWISYQGQQAVLLDVAQQQFRIFSITFFPQDFMILAWVFMAGAFALFFVTNWLGRVWCGYMCPQTVWMLLFTWVEHRIEGTRNQRIKLDKQPWGFSKVMKKAAKHAAWLGIAFFTATTFMSYFIPAKELYSQLLAFTWGGLTSFWVFLFALCTYGNAGWLREKMCIYMCPYSRFQSVMFDKDTLIVSYDSERGETRGPRKRKAAREELALGDCVDCKLCVEVCPAGIDIRNGLQYECINCGLCIDACDQTMDKFNYPRGLISYTSERQQEGGKTSILRLKLLGYAAMTVLVFVVMAWWLSSRTPLEVYVSRDRGELSRTDYRGWVENPYRISVVNKTQQQQAYQISIAGLEGAKLAVHGDLSLAPGEQKEIPVTVSIDGYELAKKVSTLTFVVEQASDPSTQQRKETRFYK